MHKGAIDLPGLHTAIFKEENAAGRIERPGRAEGSLDEVHAAAEDNAFGKAAKNRFTLQIQFPRRCRAGYRRFERWPVIALRSISTGIEAGGDHRAVKTGPVTFLPQENLQGGDVAVADDAFRRQTVLDAEFIEHVIGTIAAAERNERRNFGVVQERSKIVQARGG